MPPVRNPATNTDNIQVDTESSAMATNNNQSKFITEDVSTTIIELPNEQPYVNNQSTHFNCISNTSNKLLVSQPPIATRNEVNEARFRLQESFLINDVRITYVSYYAGFLSRNVDCMGMWGQQYIAITTVSIYLFI